MLEQTYNNKRLSNDYEIINLVLVSAAGIVAA